MYVALAHVPLIEDAEAMSQVSVLGCMAQRCPPQEEPGASLLLCPVCKNFLFPGGRHSPGKRNNLPAMRKLELSPEWAGQGYLEQSKLEVTASFFGLHKKCKLSVSNTTWTNKDFDRHSAAFYLQYN